jgi:hypothetical protein
MLSGINSIEPRSRPGRCKMTISCPRIANRRDSTVEAVPGMNLQNSHFTQKPLFTTTRRRFPSPTRSALPRRKSCEWLNGSTDGRQAGIRRPAPEGENLPGV